ncbi:hypothetical protein OHA28_50335 [Streptomyces sp. NBC_00269]|uniref:hypothetical protein n=1 Tax=Streptomyces sp. NBC_00269 TaxID=2975696 RepID=UPI002E2B6175|nr:hypothetical protein [Streptomyces sp. NBC_00269]
MAFTSQKNRDQLVTPDDFFDVVDEAWARSYRRNVTETLALLRTTRQEATEYVQDAFEPDGVLPQALEPLIPSVRVVTDIWSQKVGRVNMLVDDQKALTDANFDDIEADIRDRGHPEFRYLSRGVHLGYLRRGRSVEHPSLQLADLLSGVGYAVGERPAGVPNPAGEDLHSVVVPLIDQMSMLPHDDY